MLRPRSRRDAFVVALAFALAAPAAALASPWSVLLHGGPGTPWTYRETRDEFGTYPDRIEGGASWSLRVGHALTPTLSVQAGAGWMRFAEFEPLAEPAIYPPQNLHIDRNVDVVPLTLGVRWSPRIGGRPPVMPWIELGPALAVARWHERGTETDARFVAAAPGFALGGGLRGQIGPAVDLETGVRWVLSGDFGRHDLGFDPGAYDGLDQIGFVLGIGWHP